MYFNYQIPLLDTRTFLKRYEGAFFNPSMLINNRKAPFCRGFGQLRYRRYGENLPLSELQFIESRKAVKFSESFPSLGLLNVSERMFEDKCVAHFDLGVKTRRRQRFTYKKLKAYFIELFQSDIFKKNRGYVDFTQIQADIASKYQRATTYKERQPKAENMRVFCGHPIVFVEYREDEILGFPPELYEYHISENVNMRYDSFIIDGMPVYVWFIKKGNRAENAKARQIRISLSKIHHNQMSVEKFINWYETQDKNTIDYLNTLDYIDKMLSIIRKQKKKAESKEIYDRALEAYRNIYGQRIQDSRGILKRNRDRLLDIQKQTKQIKVSATGVSSGNE